MSVPTVAKPEALSAGIASIAYRETFKTPTGTVAPSENNNARPISGAVYPRPTR